MRFFEQMAVGQRRELGSFTFTAEAIKKFAAQFDPNPDGSSTNLAADLQVNLDAAAAPEPATLLMALIGIATLAVYAWGRSRHSASLTTNAVAS